jgi:hypothetical protein
MSQRTRPRLTVPSGATHLFFTRWPGLAASQDHERFSSNANRSVEKVSEHHSLLPMISGCKQA